jgi:hypothetical protein
VRLSVKKAPAFPVEDPGPSETPSTRVMTVMVVDDDFGVASFARDTLGSAGYLVLSTADPVEAMRIAKDWDDDIDLLLVDVVMPLMDEALLQRPAGIFLVTGPTGSGKSTTLYACLMRLHRPEIRIPTAEDPVEYVYDELSQAEVNDEIGDTFAAYLRAFLRHDSEIIMVGEIRDQATAEIAFRAAQTGHLLLSTLHTNSAIAALPRLLDLEVESSLIASSLIGVMSQRLLRRDCAACRQEYVPSSAVRSEIFDPVPASMRFYQGAGCAECGFTGYRGRMMVADLWVPDEQDAGLITRQAPFDEICASPQHGAGRPRASARRHDHRGGATPRPALRRHRRASAALFSLTRRRGFGVYKGACESRGGSLSRRWSHWERSWSPARRARPPAHPGSTRSSTSS